MQRNRTRSTDWLAKKILPMPGSRKENRTQVEGEGEKRKIHSLGLKNGKSVTYVDEEKQIFPVD